MAGSPIFSTPTDYSAQQADIERQRRVAEMLQQQSMEPLQTNQTAGGFVIPVSPYAGLAKALQGYAGMAGQRKATEREAALAQSLAGNRQADLQQFMRLRDGTPESWVGDASVPGDSVQTPAQPGDRRAAMSFLASSKDPSLAQVGLAEMLKTPESNFAKVDPKDFTAASVLKFSQTGNHADLVPVRKKEAVSGVAGANGPETRFVDPYADQTPLPQAVKPEAVTTAGPTGAPQTSFVNPYGQTAPLPQPVRNEMVNTGPANVPVNPYTQTAPIANGVSPNTVATNNVTLRGQNLGVDPAVQGALAGAKAAGQVTGQSTAQAQIDLPGAVAKADQAVKLVDEMIGDAGRDLPKGTKARAPHPGFGTAVGATIAPGLRFVEGSDTASFMKLLDQVKGGAFLQAFEALKGGGQITEVEGAKATAAITRMDKAQSEAEFIKAAREFQGVIRQGVQRAQQKANPQRRASDAPGAVIRFDASGNPL
jgi:hypothetical protein